MIRLDRLETIAVAVLFILSAMQGLLHAQASLQEDDGPGRNARSPSTAQSKPSVQASVIARGYGSLPAGLADSDGEFSTSGVAADARVQIKLSEEFSLVLGIGGGETRYDFEDAFHLDPLGGRPVETVSHARLSGALSWSLSSNWSADVLLFAAFAGESDSDLDEGTIYGGTLSATHRFSKNLSLGLGLWVSTRLENDPWILPLPIIRLKLDIFSGLYLAIGVPDGIRIGYLPSKGLSISLKGGLGSAVSIQDVRLDDEGFAPGGVFRQRGIPVSVTIDWDADSRAKISLDVGVVVARSFEIDDKNGNSLTKEDAESAVFLALSFRLTF